MSENSKDKSPPVAPGNAIQVFWGTDPELKTQFANNLFISHTESQFYLVFGELIAPMILDFEREKHRIPSAVEVKPLARFVISPKAMEKFIEAMQENYQKYLGKQSEQSMDQKAFDKKGE